MSAWPFEHDPAEAERDAADAEFDARMREADRFAEYGPLPLARPNHGKPPKHDHRPVIAGRRVSPAIAEFLAEKHLDQMGGS